MGDMKPILKFSVSVFPFTPWSCYVCCVSFLSGSICVYHFRNHDILLSTCMLSPRDFPPQNSLFLSYFPHPSYMFKTLQLPKLL